MKRAPVSKGADPDQLREDQEELETGRSSRRFRSSSPYFRSLKVEATEAPGAGEQRDDLARC